jgi:signal transduction histidine kinase
MGRTLSDPLRHLAHTARRMAAGDLSARARTGRRDELGDLAEQFNVMATALERNFHELAAERDSLRRFVGDASHELRTPVTALATFMELLEGPAADDEAARREFVRESRQQVERLAWIVENLLDLSRLDAGIAALTLGRHDAGDLLAAAAAPHLAAAARKRVSVEVRRPDPPIALGCDRQRAEMALSNLFANAVKFSRAGGRVEAWAETVVADGRTSVRMAVRDDGPGIAADDLPKIFDRFYRGRGAPSEGAGLGLAIVRSVAAAHGGTVRVESEPGRGSTFSLELPVEAAAAAPPLAVGGPASGLVPAGALLP